MLVINFTKETLKLGHGKDRVILLPGVPTPVNELKYPAERLEKIFGRDVRLLRDVRKDGTHIQAKSEDNMVNGQTEETIQSDTDTTAKKEDIVVNTEGVENNAGTGDTEDLTTVSIDIDKDIEETYSELINEDSFKAEDSGSKPNKKPEKKETKTTGKRSQKKDK